MRRDHIILMDRALWVMLADHGDLPLLFEQVFYLGLRNGFVEWLVDILLIESLVLDKILFLGIVLIFITLVGAMGAQKVECVLGLVQVLWLVVTLFSQKVEATD